MPDWMVNRYVGLGASLLAGLCADWGWVGCAIAWIAVALILLAWSALEHEGKL